MSIPKDVNVTIEGEVTPEKIRRAEDFEKIFLSSTAEVLELAAYIPDPILLNLIKSGTISENDIRKMKDASPWTTFVVQGKSLMKTPDNKLELVQNYCFRLEKAVLAQVDSKKQLDEKYQKQLKDINTALTSSIFQKMGWNLDKKLDNVKRSLNNLKQGAQKWVRNR
jgi:hypothetical protein